MNQDRTNRKLAAIFSTDVVGYSRMMEADEAWTIQNLEENKQLMSSLIEEYKGRVVDSPGDNLLAEFSSVINAVDCAVKIQKELNRKNSKLMEDHRMLFRIGVNLGDVVEEDGKIYGNGVNIAARLEGLAEPGGVCISRTAYDQVKNKIELDYDYLGEYQVKNINEPVRVYRILQGGDSTEKYVPHGSSQGRVISLKVAIAAIIAVIIISVGVTIAIRQPKPPEPKQVVRLPYNLPENRQFNSKVLMHLALASDGSKFAYSASNGISLRSMEKLDDELISGTNDDPQSPFFSPDGKWIGYFSADSHQLKKIPVSGGESIILCEGTWVGGAIWNEDDTILYGDASRGIMRISVKGGKPEMLIEAKEGDCFFPQFLQDGKLVLFTQYLPQSRRVIIQSLESKKRTDLFPGDSARYLSTGHIIYCLDNVLFAVRFDINTLETVGAPIRMVEGISSNWEYSISDSGMLMYIPSVETSAITRSSLVWVDRAGNEETIAAPPDIYSFPKISPDGSRIALSIGGLNADIWIWNLERKIKTKLTSDHADAFGPLWTPEGQTILFTSGLTGIYQVPANGTEEIKQLVSSVGMALIPMSWSGDKKTLVVNKWSGRKNDIELLSVEEALKMRPLLQEQQNEMFPQISPDGRRIAYMSDETGQYEIYVRPFPDINKGKVQISTEGGLSPLWSPDSRELFYRNGNSVFAVKFKEGAGLNPGTPEVLFTKSFLSSNQLQRNIPLWDWDIHPVSKRFLMLKSVEPSEQEITPELPHKINIVLNWFEELKAKVPVD